jgi:cell division protein ZapA (FtsZ GTPase activity inhibitor)
MKNHKVELGGTGFMIRSDVDEARIRRIETFLNRKLKEMSGRGQRVNFSDSLVLMLFHVTDLMLDAEESGRKVRSSTVGSVRDLRNEIEEIEKLVKQRLESAEDTIS